MKFAVSGMRRTIAAAGALWLGLIAVSAPVSADPAIWQVEGGPKPVWLFGTFHLLPPETKWQTLAVNAAFERSDVLVVEARLDTQAIADTQKIIKEKAFLRGNRRLRDLLSADDRATYEMIGNRLGMFPAILDNYRPWYASVLLSVALYREQGFRPEAGVDLILQNRAKASGMPIQQLETAREQLNFLADMSRDAQLDMLRATLREAETIPEQIDAMLNAWEEGDTKTMDALFNDALREFPEAYDRLLVQRNRKWVPHVEKMVADSNGYFIAVGTAHLVGRHSVVTMLREKGYVVRGP